MGSSGKDEVDIADCGVGSIVWVRRRNGSWWPGKILGPDELSTAHLVSPRSGTPVKLLGKEDASVDWYNLEKSKRVKPFRCGEFDECIEKAEAALGLPPKKREKYARREDAILHALELEKQLLEEKSGNFDSPIESYGNKSFDEVKKESEIYSESSDFDNIGKNVDLKRGSKKLDKFDHDISISDLIYESSGIKSSFQKKRKSSDDDCYDDDHLASRNQFARSPSRTEVDNFSRPATLDGDSSGSESTESTETDSSKTHSMNTDEDGFAEAALIPEAKPKSLEISGQVRHKSTNRMTLDDDDVLHFYSHEPLSPSLGESKWRSKGKRNNRSLSKTSSKATDLWAARGSMYTADLEDIESDGFEETNFFRARKRPYKVYDWDDFAWNEHPTMRGYWEELCGGHRHGGKMASVLVDVNLKVQTSYQRQRVPMISLMSKLNGNAIVGHPIQVQILEYGSTDSLLEKLEEDIKNFSNGKLKKAPFRKPNVARKVNSREKFPKKSPKKTRFGSNFGSENENSFRAGDLINATVACIPLKLVFCRLNEELVDRHNKNLKRSRNDSDC